MHRRWLVSKTNQEFIRYLSKSASVSPVLAQILINRGVKTAGEVAAFLNPCLADLSDPFEITGMKTAVGRILAASKNGERVLVHGDYDADGISAAAIALGALEAIGIDCISFIPNRTEHGYGFSPASLIKAKETGASLILTVDCGISSFEAAALSKKQGIDVVITDHHEPVVDDKKKGNDGRFLIPDALAIVNPKVSGCQSPAVDLSGAGLSFKLAHALSLVHDSKFSVLDLLDLAALGTMADVVPLTGENRIIVREGLGLIEKGARPGLRALKQVAGIEGKTLRTGSLLFSLVPRINAAGRISDASGVLELMLTGSEDKAAELAAWLDGLNSERQRIEEEVYREALSQLSGTDARPVIVLAGEGWNRGVIGIVASRLTEKFYRPSIILSLEGDRAIGSARSIPAFDMYKALGGCKEFLERFGGHRQAAGLQLVSRDIGSFEACINRIAREALSGEDLVPSLEIDANVELPDLDFGLTREFEALEPFGFGNPEPFLGSKGLEVLYPKIVKDTHLKMKLRQRNHSFDAIGFDMASLLESLDASAMVDAVYTPRVNEWQGRRCVQLNLKALRPSR